MSAANLVQIRRLLAELAEPARVVPGAETFLVFWLGTTVPAQ